MFGQTLDATDLLCAVSGFGRSHKMKYFCHRCWKSVVHGFSGETYPYFMKEDFFSLEILHENSLWQSLF